MQREREILMLPGTRMVVDKINGVDEDRCEVHVSTLWPQAVLPIRGPILTPIIKRKRSSKKSVSSTPRSGGRTQSLHVRKQLFLHDDGDEGLGKKVPVIKKSKSQPVLSIDTRKESNVSQASASSGGSWHSASSSFSLSGSISSFRGLFAKRDSLPGRIHPRKKPPTPIPVNLSPNLKKDSKGSVFTFDAITEAEDELREASEINLWQLIDVAHPGWEGEIEDLTYLSNAEQEEPQANMNGAENEHENKDMIDESQGSMDV